MRRSAFIGLIILRIFTEKTTLALGSARAGGAFNPKEINASTAPSFTSPPASSAAGEGPQPMSPPVSPHSNGDIGERLSRSHFEFTLTLFRALSLVEDPQNNIVFSPLLVSTLLTPTLLAANEYTSSLSHQNNDTRSFLQQFSKQILQVLSLSDLSANSAEAWHRATIASLQDNYYKNFLKGTRSFLVKEKSVTTEEGHLALKKYFGSALKIVSQPIDSSSVLHDINTWVRNKTKNKIETFVSEKENLLKSSEKVLLSAAFVKPFWLNDFDPNATFQKGLFYPTYRDRFEIPMMRSRLRLPLGYSPSLEARVLEIPFELRRASLFIVLPDHMEQPLTTLESNLTSENMRSLLSTLKTEVVNLRLPRFSVDTTLMMLKPLNILGVNTGTSSQSDRKKNTERKIEILPDRFIHKVRMEIDEGKSSGGSDVTSATGSLSGRSSVDESFGKLGEKYFEVDHSFIFFIWDYIASTILCMGRVVDPRIIQSKGGSDPSERSG